MKKKFFLEFAPYHEYVEASEADSFIRVLNETNNTYRTIIAMLLVEMGIELYDWFLYDLVSDFGIMGRNVISLVVCLLITVLFIYSYKKQTNYIKKRVENHIKAERNREKQNGES